MLIYGDQIEVADPSDRIVRIAEQLERIAAMPAGIGRHSAIVGTLIDSGQLLQGVTDAGLADEESLSAFVHRLAHCVVRSWDSGFSVLEELPCVPILSAGQRVKLSLPEGFAYYAVYPEAYAEAARQLTLSGPPRVIGIRSIGTSLGAVVAAALGAPMATTVRPFGDPFDRQVELPAEPLEADAHYVIVDEGPGLSGSSFGAVADSLEERGVPLERIAFLPSHAGDPGPQMSDAHRRRWREVQRIPADFGGRLPDLLRAWAGNRLAPCDSFRFVGLGGVGQRKFEMARTLGAAGFSPEALALVHGFLVERPCERAEPLAADEKPVAEIGRYIAARAELFPADEGAGAGVAQLIEMCRRNILLALGEDSARWLDFGNAEGLGTRLTRVCTDSRLDRENWLRSADGRLIKSHVVDQGHNLVGCQDPAWDVAGAVTEFAMDERETERLVRAVEHAGRAIDRELVAFYRIAYAAFRLGEATLAGRADAARYASVLRDLLHQHVCSGRPRKSSVG